MLFRTRKITSGGRTEDDNGVSRIRFQNKAACKCHKGSFYHIEQWVYMNKSTISRSSLRNQCWNFNQLHLKLHLEFVCRAFYKLFAFHLNFQIGKCFSYFHNFTRREKRYALVCSGNWGISTTTWLSQLFTVMLLALRCADESPKNLV